MNRLLLTTDFGTQSVRVGVISTDGVLVAEHSTSYHTYYPVPGRAEQKPEEWIASFKNSLSNVTNSLTAAQRALLTTLNISATASTVVPIDKRGEPIGNAILWMDNRASTEAFSINKTNHPVLQHCGGAVSSEWLISKILWYKNNDPKTYERTYKFVEFLDFINFHLTGELVSSLCNNVCKANYVEELGGWNEQFFNLIGLSDFKEKMVINFKRVGQPIGKLRPSYCIEYGLPSSMTVLQGCIDAYAGMIGLGAVKEGLMAAIMGTSFVGLCLSPTEFRTKGVWGPYKDALIEGNYVYEGGQVAAGSILKWFKQMVGSISYDELSKEAELSPIGSNGLVSLDFFQGNRTPYKEPRLRGEIKGLTLSHTRGDIYRSLMEAVAYGTRNMVESIAKGQIPINTFMASGGVTKDPLWISIIADVCKVPITITKSSSYAGLMGSAIISAVSEDIYASYEEAASVMIQIDRVVEPNPVHSVLYEKGFTKYLQESDAALQKLCIEG